MSSPRSSPPARCRRIASPSAPQLIFNQRLDGWLTVFFTFVLWFVILDMLRVAYCRITGRAVLPSSEAPYRPSQLNGITGQAHA